MTDGTESPNTLLTPTLRALLLNIIDYAGMFPPADLSLDEAIRNYAHYRHGRESWMLGRFVIPVGRLDDLTAYSNLFAGSSPFEFSVLGAGGNRLETFIEAFERDLEAIDHFEGLHDDRVRADVMEVRLPTHLLGADLHSIQDFMRAVDRRLVRVGMAKLDLFYEIPLDERTSDVLPPALAAMAEHNSHQSVPARSTAGLKIRCGGLEPDAFPAPEHVAFAIARCRDAGVPFKATAGLHHPLRHYDDTVGTMAHGFFNVFGAAVLAAEHTLAPDDIEAVLREDNPDRFQFTKNLFGWGGLTAPLEAIQHARDRLAHSFGSCSFEEPRDDLKELELL